jgi:hypothetical protein
LFFLSPLSLLKIALAHDIAFTFACALTLAIADDLALVLTLATALAIAFTLPHIYVTLTLARILVGA